MLEFVASLQEDRDASLADPSSRFVTASATLIWSLRIAPVYFLPVPWQHRWVLALLFRAFGALSLRSRGSRGARAMLVLCVVDARSMLCVS